MRVDLLAPVGSLRADQRAIVIIQVRNDGDVIEQVVGSVDGLGKQWYEFKPPQLNLFPGEVGELRLTLMLPHSFPAGEHELQVWITSQIRRQTLLQPVTINVEPLFEMLLVSNPTVITARRRGRFLVTLQNRGNDPVEMAVRAADSEAALELELDRAVLDVAPGRQETTALYARGKRPWFGAPVSHTIEVTAERLPEVLTERVTLRLRPRLTAGLLTALTLATIVAVWAAVLLLSANAAFGTDKPTKTVPGSFSSGGVSVASLDPAVVGGSLSGIVTAVSTKAPLARITVELWAGHAETFITAVASGSNGSYKFEAVLPGSYRLRFRAEGFIDQFYPSQPTLTTAQVLVVKPGSEPTGIDQKMAGLPGSLTTTVVTADGSTVPVTVTIEAAGAPGAVPIAAQPGTTGEPITFTGLTTPATYRIRAESPDYLVTESNQQVAAGAPVTANPITLAASAGQITGTVVDAAGAPLGDIAIVTTVGGNKVATVTPTIAPVGTFAFTQLPTPATYVLELSGTSVATKVVAVRVEANGVVDGLTIPMSSATATLNGVVTADGSGLGGATVTVSGGGFSSTATTFTANPPGSYTVTGVPVPGTYVVTVSAPGRVSSTSTVTIAPGQTTATVDAQLLPATGQVYGTVTLDGVPVGAATVTVSDGTNAPASTVSATVGDVGGYEVGGLSPGIYSVTATYGAGTANAAGPVTVLVTVGVNPEQPGQPIVLAL